MGVAMANDAGKMREEPEKNAFQNVEPVNFWDFL